MIEMLELRSQDIRFLIRGDQQPSGKIVIGTIDEKSIATLGRYPWPRVILAEVIRILSESGAKVIGIDLILTEPENNPEFQRIQKLITSFTTLGLLTDDPNHQAFFNELAEASEGVNYDMYLSEVIQKAGNVILAMIFGSSKNHSPKIESFDSAIYPIDFLNQSAAGVGFVNIIHDPDGAVRRAYPSLVFKDQMIPSFPVKIAQLYLNIPDHELRLVNGVHFQMGDIVMPLTKDNTFYINYYGNVETIPHISVSDILTEQFDKNLFKDKCVFIGGAAIGLGDHWANPFSGSFWGVELQATIADNLLSKQFVNRSDATKYIDICLIALFGLLVTFFSIRLRIAKTIFVPFLAILCYGIIVQMIFQINGTILLFVLPSIEIFTISFGIFLWRYVHEEREKRFIKEAFQHYIHPAVVERLIDHPERLQLGGEKKELTVMFSDIRNFTNISETISPEKLVKFINEYFTLMTDVIQNNFGTLDKYIGDAIMAIFGAPEDQKDHEFRACKTALLMFEALYQKRQQWIAEGFEQIRIGIGISSGEMIVGNMGSGRRFSYTVMGDPVNQAARLESISKYYGVKIIVSESVREKIKNTLTFRELDYIRVKGKSQPLRIFELIGKDYYTNGKYKYIQTFEAGLAAYRQKDLNEAIRLFDETLTYKPNDQPSIIYKKRCEDLKSSPSQKDWDYIFDISTK